MIYDIYLLQLIFQTVAVVRKICSEGLS